MSLVTHHTQEYVLQITAMENLHQQQQQQQQQHQQQQQQQHAAAMSRIAERERSRDQTISVFQVFVVAVVK